MMWAPGWPRLTGREASVATELWFCPGDPVRLSCPRSGLSLGMVTSLVSSGSGGCPPTTPPSLSTLVSSPASSGVSVVSCVLATDGEILTFCRAPILLPAQPLLCTEFYSLGLHWTSDGIWFTWNIHNSPIFYILQQNWIVLTSMLPWLMYSDHEIKWFAYVEIRAGCVGVTLGQIGSGLTSWNHTPPRGFNLTHNWHTWYQLKCNILLWSTIFYSTPRPILYLHFPISEYFENV